MSHQRLDRVIGWCRTATRRHITKIIWWWRRTYPDLAFPTGWALITLSAFQTNIRAWEASIGIFLMVYVVVKLALAYLTAKAAAVARKRDVQGN